MSSQILIYSGTGASEVCQDSFKRHLEEHVDTRRYQIIEFNPYNCSWALDYFRPTSMIGVGGGNAIYMWSGLKEQANLIQKTVNERGAAYFGICAGGILGCSALAQAPSPGTILEYQSDLLGLSLYPGIAAAPLFDINYLVDSQNCRTIQVAYPSLNMTYPLFHKNGAFFISPHEYPNTTALSFYQSYRSRYSILQETRNFNPIRSSEISSVNLPESILYQNNPTSGKVLLTGSHAEIDSESFAHPDFSYLDHQKKQDFVRTFTERGDALDKVWKSNLEALGIACKPQND